MTWRIVGLALCAVSALLVIGAVGALVNGVVAGLSGVTP